MTTLDYQTRQFRLLTDWYLSVLDGVAPADGSRTLSSNTNSLEWLAGHLLVTRCRNIERLGGRVEPLPFWQPTWTRPCPHPASGLSTRTEPTLAWPNVGRHGPPFRLSIFLAALTAANELMLHTVLPLSGPTGGNTVEDLLPSLVLHESFHIGQMSIIRKALGYPAMYWFQRAGD